MLALSRKTNESIMLGSDIEISILEIKGDQVKIGINAPKSVPIFRKEIFLQIEEENKQEETDEETDEDEYQVSTDVWDDEIRPYSASLIESIREYDSDCVIIVQTPVQEDCLSDVANNPLEYSNIIYSISIFGEYDEVMGQELIDISEEGLPMICTDLRIYGEDNEFLEDDFTSYDELLKSEYISWCAYYIGGDASYGNMIDNSYMDAQAVADAHWPDAYITETGLFVRDVIIENALDREDYYQRRLEEETEDGDEYDDDEEDEEDTTSSTQG